jgi:diacylglycerol kinase
MEPCPNPYYFALIVLVLAVFALLVAWLSADMTAIERSLDADSTNAHKATKRSVFRAAFVRYMIAGAVVVAVVAVLLWKGAAAGCPPVLS